MFGYRGKGEGKQLEANCLYDLDKGLDAPTLEAFRAALESANTPKGAFFSHNRKYRYILWRVFDPSLPRVNFIGLNPSTADEFQDDHTIRRCMRFASDWGYGGFYMTNLFAFRSTYPSELLKQPEPIGPENDMWLAAARDSCAMVICCWGGVIHQTCLAGRAGFVSAHLRLKYHLGLTGSGYPRHPSRLPNGVCPIEWRAAR